MRGERQRTYAMLSWKPRKAHTLQGIALSSNMQDRCKGYVSGSYAIGALSLCIAVR